MARHLSCEQLELILDYMTAHKDLARGLMRSVDGRAECKRLWEDLTAQLNACEGVQKTVGQWQKVWWDKKYATKKSAAAANKSATATGGGPSTSLPLTDWEIRIINIMGDGFDEPQTTARVNAFTSNNINNEILSYSAEERPTSVASLVSLDVEPAAASTFNLLETVESDVNNASFHFRRLSADASRPEVRQSEPSHLLTEQTASSSSIFNLREPRSSRQHTINNGRQMVNRRSNDHFVSGQSGPASRATVIASSSTRRLSAANIHPHSRRLQRRRPVLNRVNAQTAFQGRLLQLEEEKRNLERQKVIELSRIRLTLSKLVELMEHPPMAQ